MKKIATILIFSSILIADVFYSQVEPIYQYSIKSSVNGEVKFSAKELEGELITNKTILRVDDFSEKEELNSIKTKLELLKKTKEMQFKQLTILKDILKVREENFNRLSSLKTKSQIEKDSDFYQLKNAELQASLTETQIISLDSQINDLKLRETILKDIIDKKNISIKDGYLYKLYVKEGDYLNYGANIADIYDVTKAKLTFFIPIEKADELKNRVIYLNDKESSYKLNKLYKVADKEFISSYKAEIYINSNEFSKLMKIEFK